MILKSLFSPGYIGLLKLKNRLVFPPMATALCAEGGFVSQNLVDYHTARASGGCGLSIVEIAGVHTTTMGKGKFGLGIYNDMFLPGLEKLAKAIKGAGGVPAIQLWHAGRQINSSDVYSGYIIAPSPIPCPICREVPRQLDINQIKEIVESFGDAAARAKDVGFEAVEIHGAHGYLICQFLSSYSNKRDDVYGGVLEKRARFAVEIVKDIRTKTGNYFPIIFRLSAEEFVPGGIDLNEAKQFAKILENNGVDALHVSAGNYQSLHYVVPPMEVPVAFNAKRASSIKEEVSIPVIVAGRINDPLIADKIISDNNADFISVGRGQLADPQFCNKASIDDFKGILKCIGCNQGCFDRLFYEKKQISCLLNPICGREVYFPGYQSGALNNKEYTGKLCAKNTLAAFKKILIAGAGPAGLSAAAMLSKLGFKVILCEKSNNTGGQFRLGSIAPDKAIIAEAISTMKHLAERSGATIMFQTEVNRSFIENINPDIILITTGSVPFLPDIPFIVNEKYMPISILEQNIFPNSTQEMGSFDAMKPIFPVTSHEVLNGTVSVKQNVAIIGGGITGVETAEFLAKQNKKVSIIEMNREIAWELSPLRKYFLDEKIKRLAITVHTSTKCTGIGHDFIEVEKDGIKMRLENAGTIVFACGTVSENKLAESLKGSPYTYFIIGDALKPEKAINAIWSAAEFSKMIYEKFAN